MFFFFFLTTAGRYFQKTVIEHLKTVPVACLKGKLSLFPHKLSVY